MNAIRDSLSVRVSLALAALLLVLTTVAGTFITWRQTAMMEDLTLDKARVAAAIGARQYGNVLEQAIDSGSITVGEAFDRNYNPIKGFNWGDKPKYHTAYDFVTDRDVLVFQDRILDHEDFVFAVGVDENGYLPTHNTVFQRPVTGDPAADLVGNRTKRMFNDPVGLAAGRNLEPSLVQVYSRDTGQRMWDVSSPITVKGKHWGGFRVAVSMERIEARKGALVLGLTVVFGTFALVAITTMLLLIRRAMRPVVALTAVADAISMGESLDVPIRSEATDEIGRLTKAVDRMRASMKAAMDRLGE